MLRTYRVQKKYKAPNNAFQLPAPYAVSILINFHHDLCNLRQLVLHQ